MRPRMVRPANVVSTPNERPFRIGSRRRLMPMRAAATACLLAETPGNPAAISSNFRNRSSLTRASKRDFAKVLLPAPSGTASIGMRGTAVSFPHFPRSDVWFLQANHVAIRLEFHEVAVARLMGRETARMRIPDRFGNSVFVSPESIPHALEIRPAGSGFESPRSIPAASPSPSAGPRGRGRAAAGSSPCRRAGWRSRSSATPPSADR